MELQFHKTTARYMKCCFNRQQQQELTQEFKLTDDQPDIDRVLGCWAQLLIRSKQWQENALQLNGGVMVWAVYQPEGDQLPQWIESWLPFQMKWDMEQREGCAFRILPGMCLSDARSASARRMILRANVTVRVEAMEPAEMELYAPEQLPEDVQVLTRECSMMVSAQIGEKVFTVEQTLPPPAGPKVEKLLYYRIAPQLLEQKILADKLVFRGNTLCHALYIAEDDQIYSMDAEVPFSQYAELDREYDPDSYADIWLANTGMEMEPDDQGQLVLKNGITAQYVVREKRDISTVADAYSPIRQLQLQQQELELPAVTEQKTEMIPMQLHVDMPIGQVLDVWVQPQQPIAERVENDTLAQMEATIQLLCYDTEDRLTCITRPWQSPWNISRDEGCRTELQLAVSGVPSVAASQSGVEVRGQLHLQSRCMACDKSQIVKALQLSEQKQPDPGRPSLIVCRCGEEGLWELAKRAGSTVDSIKKANALEGEPQPGKMLLIPVL